MILSHYLAILRFSRRFSLYLVPQMRGVDERTKNSFFICLFCVQNIVRINFLREIQVGLVTSWLVELRN